MDKNGNCETCGGNLQLMPDHSWYCHDCAVNLEAIYHRYKHELPESMPYDTMIQLHNNIYLDCEKIAGIQLDDFPTKLLKGSEYKARVQAMRLQIIEAWNSF